MKRLLTITLMILLILLLPLGYFLYLAFENNQFGERLKFFTAGGVPEVTTAVMDGQEYLISTGNVAELCEIILRGSLYTRKPQLFLPTLEGEVIELQFGDSIHVTAQQDPTAEDTCLLSYQDGSRTIHCLVSGLNTFAHLKETVEDGNLPVSGLSEEYEEEMIRSQSDAFAKKLAEEGFYPAIRACGTEALTDAELSVRQRLAEISQYIVLQGTLGEAVCDYVGESDGCAVARIRLQASRGEFSCLLFWNPQGGLESLSLAF